jgi:kynurenine formamidase
VLVDVARPVEIDASSNRGITPAELDATLAAQGVEIEPGDVLLLRTGWVAWYRSADTETRQALPGSLRAPGLRPGDDMLRWLWDHHVAAIGADNPSVETWPPGSHLTVEQLAEVRTDPSKVTNVFMHTALLPLLGIPLGEMWDLDSLAADCAADGRYVGLFTSAPLRVHAGVASPPNALVLK